ncbi:MAG: guanylate kinase [Candidatus Omnitrophica bacterium]|nr:guanylate kinase [Candidatus Omnitrophota bacterium]
MSPKTKTLRPGTLVVLSAPSGCGKTSVVERLLKRHPDWVRSVSATTRPPRTDEKDQRDYFFLSEREFVRRIEEGRMLEHAVIYGKLYGTPKDFVSQEIAKGKIVILTIDVQGTRQVMKSWKGQGSLLSVFILPPSIKALRERLEGRATETPEEIERRVGIAQDEIKAATLYDHTVMNQSLDQAVLEVENIILKHAQQRRET